MSLVDEITIHAEAGAGGNGVIRWRHEKFIAKGGPSGGNGGRGGDVYARAVKSMHSLAFYRGERSFKAEAGEAGGSRSMHGKDGEDIYLSFPRGTIIKNTSTGDVYRLDNDDDTVLLLKGGRGGKGNEHFKSSTNVSPYVSTDGTIGEVADFFVELELFADVGLIGLPNAGKSSLLNSLTNAQAKVGDYAFTTLDPNLGAYHDYIIADIPGLIEGASSGKGLGVKFLKHIKRTNMLVHLVSFENELAQMGGMMKVYKDIRGELEKYGGGLAEKKEVILLTKTDVVEDKKLIDTKIKEFEKLGKPVFAVTLFDDAAVKKFSDELVKILEKGK